MQDLSSEVQAHRFIRAKREGQRVAVYVDRDPDGPRREAEVKLSSVPAAKGLERHLNETPIGTEERLEAWILRCADDFMRELRS